MSAGAVSIANLTVKLGPLPALLDVHLEVPPGGRLAVVGPSGAGKTTLLRAIAGLVVPRAGSIRISGREATRAREVLLPPEHRRVGLVFQSLALWPHMTVERTLAFAGAGDGARELAARVGLDKRLRSTPDQLSGGEQQRLALARALAPDPEVLLLDEPFAHLDAPLRAELAEWLLELLAERGTTLLVATHQREVAFALARDLVVLDHGAVRDAGPLDALTLAPRSATTVRQLGLGTVLEGRFEDPGLRTPFGLLSLEGEGKARCAVVRPEQVRLVAPDEGASARVLACELARPDAREARFALVVEREGTRLRALSTQPRERGELLGVQIVGPCRRVSPS